MTKCLSVSQPFASLIVTGQKTIDLRTWNTRFRGEFFIHAPQRVRTIDCIRLGGMLPPGPLPTGVIIGKATIHGVKVYGSKAEIERDAMYHHAGAGFERNRYGFLLKGAKEFKVPVPCKGTTKFFEVRLPPEYMTTPDASENADLQRFCGA